MAVVRRACGTRRVGHAGTLDPFATGLLVVLLGRATRLARFLVGLSKQYQGTIRLGLTTSTDDLTGEPLRTSDGWRGLAPHDVGDAMQRLVGAHSQRPPRFSAKKVAGRRAHRRARRGEDFELEPQRVEVGRFQLTALRGDDLDFTASVGSGVYLRALARDLGELLGCGAHLRSLRRTAVGALRVTDAIPLDSLTRREPVLLPARAAVAHLSPLQIDAARRVEIRHGRAIPAPPATHGTVALLDGEDLVAVAEVDHGVLRPSVVLDRA